MTVTREHRWKPSVPRQPLPGDYQYIPHFDKVKTRLKTIPKMTPQPGERQAFSPALEESRAVCSTNGRFHRPGDLSLAAIRPARHRKMFKNVYINISTEYTILNWSSVSRCGAAVVAHRSASKSARGARRRNPSRQRRCMQRRGDPLPRHGVFVPLCTMGHHRRLAPWLCSAAMTGGVWLVGIGGPRVV